MSICLSPSTLIVLWICIDICSSGRMKYKHTPTPQDDWELTCFTCREAVNNSICNRLAIDRPCPKGTDYCYTHHMFSEDGTSILVNKKCATKAECTLSEVGCFQSSNHMKCVSCCDIQYCNDFIPTNSSSALLVTTRNSGCPSVATPSLVAYLIIFTFFLFIPILNFSNSKIMPITF